MAGIDMATLEAMLKANGMQSQAVQAGVIANREKGWSDEQFKGKIFSGKGATQADVQRSNLMQHNAQIQPDSELSAKKLNALITVDPDTIKLKETVVKLSGMPVPVLIVGETGTGKENIAAGLHGRKAGKFMPLNCGGFPDHIVDSILFGHRKGSFTGAIDDGIGLFTAAHNGTIFLDEISRLPAYMQPKLLRVLESKIYMRVGDTQLLATNARVVTATNQELKDNPLFQQDLYWRISTFILRTKPLRDRQHDVKEFLVKCNIKPELADRIVALNYSWPGNYRELKQAVQRYRFYGYMTIGDIVLD